MALADGVYDEEYQPTYKVRDESYTGPDESHVPRFHLERVVPTGRMSWGLTTYKSKAAADKAAAFLQSLVLDEVP